jgi:hypothetical protein
VARWPDRDGVPIRVEHWTNACEQGAHAAKNLVAGDAVPYTSLPYFWSDQYGIRIQYCGRRDPEDEIVVFKSEVDEASLVGLYGGGPSGLSAVLSFKVAGTFMRLRQLLHRRGTFSDAVSLLTQAGFQQVHAQALPRAREPAAHDASGSLAVRP